MSSTFGHRFRVTTFGESHAAALGAIVDGCPPHLELSEADLQPQLDRRRPGQSRLTTQRKEDDQIKICSGVENGVTLGTPIGLIVENKDFKPGDYAAMRDVPRPSHADFTYRAKYGLVAGSGGGRASARETVARVAAGAIAEKLLRLRHGVDIVAWVSSVGVIDAPAELAGHPPTRDDVDANEVRCPDAGVAALMVEAIETAQRDRDSLGGIVTCVCSGIPPGLGEPVFHKLEAVLATAMLSLPATKGFEIGSGFAGTRMRGSEHNDLFVGKGDSIGTATNRSGGVQGGISNGEPIVFRVAFKPTSTIAKPQSTVNYDGESVTLEGKGRHDPCVLPRAVPIVDSMAALVLADASLQA